MTGAEIQHRLRWDISHPIQPLSRANECSKSLLCTSGQILWANRLHQRGLPCIVASMHIHIEMNQVLCWTWMLDTQPDTEDDVVVPAMYSWGNWTWLNTYVHIHSGAHNIMYEVLPTPVRRVLESSNMSENTYMGHWYKNFNFDFFLCRKVWVLAGFLRCMPPTRKFVNKLQIRRVITKTALHIMTLKIMTT